MKPFDHQESISDKALEILRANLIVYLAMEERTGKTLTAILTYEKSKAKNILVVTKKKAIDGWNQTLEAYVPKKVYTVINYESLHKLNPEEFDAVIIDEAHSNLSAYPKIGKIWQTTYKFTKHKPIIFLSATPSAQTYAQLYHQLKLSSWSPWVKYVNFYQWHKEYGIPEIIFLQGRQVKQYHNVKAGQVMDDINHLFLSYTRQELGFLYEPEDIIHYVDMEPETKVLYNDLLKHQVVNIDDLEVVADTPMSLRVKLHQIEGGTIKYEDTSITLGNNEKANYIKREFGDTKELVIFYHYQQEKEKLHSLFKQATILQATSFAEGVDLSMFKTLVIYSMDFSTARYTQRRARQCNMSRKEPIDVHYLLTREGISDQVYKTVAVNKTNFVDKYFDRKTL